LRVATHAPSRSSFPVVMADDAPKTKITVRPPAAASGSDGKTKVTVRVRSPSERAAAVPAVAASPATGDDDGSTKITVKAPVKAAPPPSPLGPKLSPSEQLLLDATQKANCSQMLAALEEGANPNVRDPNGRTPLHFMSGVGLAPGAALLIHFGAQVDALDNGGLTPLHMAAGYANAQTLRVLVTAGADTTIESEQGTAEAVVCSLGDYQLSQMSNRKGLEKLKKKDEKLEKLKACMDVLLDPEKVREEEDWDTTMTEVLKAINTQLAVEKA